MVETIFAVIAAIVTVIFAGLLVRRQTKQREAVEELSKLFADEFAEVAIQYEALTNEKTCELTIDELEKKVEQTQGRLRSIAAMESHSYLRRSRYVKSKQNFTDH